MRPRHRATYRFIARSAFVASLSLLATTPVPAHAARLALTEWGLSFFFAVAASVVIVLLLYEIVGEHANHDQAPDRRPANKDRRMARRQRGTVQ